jgi:hypothetical protein
VQKTALLKFCFAAAIVPQFLAIFGFNSLSDRAEYLIDGSAKGWGKSPNLLTPSRLRTKSLGQGLHSLSAVQATTATASVPRGNSAELSVLDGSATMYRPR